MSVPAARPVPEGTPSALPWAALSAEQKRARALRVAGDLFARDGLAVPMPVIADAIGVGVGSIYRQVGNKEDLIALLCVDRIDRLADVVQAALGDADPVTGMRRTIHAVVDQSVTDHVIREAWTAAAEHPVVVAARLRLSRGLDQLVAAAARDGALRPDASADDLRLLFTAMKDVDDPVRARRLADLVLRGMVVPEQG